VNHQTSKKLLREWDGPMTRDLVLKPGNFGLGRVPARLRPEAITRVVCGFVQQGVRWMSISRMVSP
jgi:assimilatory nitrate reductase catalytic subunit